MPELARPALTPLEKDVAAGKNIIYRSEAYRLAVLVDPFPSLVHGVVIAPDERVREGGAHLQDLPYSRYQQVQAVGQVMLRKMRQIILEGKDPAISSETHDPYMEDKAAARADTRSLLHLEGFGILEQPHLVAGLAPRTAGAKLYDPTVSKASAERLDLTTQLISLSPEETAGLESKLDILASIAVALDDVMTVPPSRTDLAFPENL